MQRKGGAAGQVTVSPETHSGAVQLGQQADFCYVAFVADVLILLLRQSLMRSLSAYRLKGISARHAPNALAWYIPGPQRTRRRIAKVSALAVTFLA
jgi:hypothetical protein